MDWSKVDWDALERLRSGFLSGAPARDDYWHKQSDLETYDFTHGLRIGWKWDHVLSELKRRGWTPPLGEALDWGCGTGVAGRKFMEYFWKPAPAPQTAGEAQTPASEPAAQETPAAVQPSGFAGLVYYDRSLRAMQFALRQTAYEFPARPARYETPAGAWTKISNGTLLISHVLTELLPSQVDQLVAEASAAEAIIWVEPGTYDASRALIDIRKRMLERFGVVAPCTHRGACGMLDPDNARHWCHHFADSPGEVHTDGNWVRFGRLAGIDLRALPLSYLVLDRREVPTTPGAVRIIGRPRVHKGHAQLFACNKDGVGDRRMLQKNFPEEFRRMKKDKFDSHQVWQLDGDKIVGIEGAK